VVLTVSVEVPAPLGREAGLNEHVGGAVVAAEPLRVMLLQESVTAWLNPPVAVTVMVEVADPPGETDAGEGRSRDGETRRLLHDKR